MLKRAIELVEGEGRLLSMQRLLMGMAYFPASYALLTIRTTECLAVYLSAFVANSGINKYLDKKYSVGTKKKP